MDLDRGGILLQIHLENYSNHQLKGRLESTLDYGEDETVRKINRKAFQRRTKGFFY